MGQAAVPMRLERIALALPLLLAAAAAARAEDAAEPAQVLAHFTRSMGDIAESVDGVVVTSKRRTDADQARLVEAGYKPHPCSQHLLGLAWDLAAPADALVALQRVAAEQGFTALIMTSPVTGNAYLHVQRYAKSPLWTAPPAEEPETAVAIEPEPEPPTPVAEVVVEAPRPLGVSGFDFPRRLLRKKADGRIVLLLAVSETGRVLDVQVDSSDLPDFDAFVASEVRGWNFSPPRIEGQPVAAVARLPIPIRIE
jgi:TonB family protein